MLNGDSITFNKKMVSPLFKKNNIKKFVTIFSGNCSITKQEKKYQKLDGTSAPNCNEEKINSHLVHWNRKT